jgi:hypothetical protein
MRDRLEETRYRKTQLGEPLMASKIAIQRPRGPIIGARFGGLSAAKSLSAAPFDVMLVGRDAREVT